MSEHQPKHTSAAHLEAFYQPFREARKRHFDGLIVTGAPIEHLEFEAVSYWSELRELFDWTQTNVHSTMGVCWGGQAMLHHFHGTPKHMLPAKAFGCFRHVALEPSSALLQGFSDSFLVPVSRWTEVRDEDLHLSPELRVLIHSEDVGPCLIEDAAHRAYYMFNHLEYNSTTLKDEYERDLAAGGPITAPVNYFPDDDPSRPPENRWRSHGAAALRQLAQRDLPDHALRGRGDRRLSDCPGGGGPAHSGGGREREDGHGQEADGLAEALRRRRQPLRRRRGAEGDPQGAGRAPTRTTSSTRAIRTASGSTTTTTRRPTRRASSSSSSCSAGCATRAGASSWFSRAATPPARAAPSTASPRT